MATKNKRKKKKLLKGRLVKEYKKLRVKEKVIHIKNQQQKKGLRIKLGRIRKTIKKKVKEKQRRKSIIELRRRKSINEVLKKGISKVTIDYNQVRNNSIALRKTYYQLLKPLIKDEEILRIMIQPENIEKIKHRIKINTTITGEERKNIMIDSYNKTLGTIISEVEELKRGGFITQQSLRTMIKNNKNILLSTENIDIYEGTGTYTIIDNPKKIVFRITLVKG